MCDPPQQTSLTLLRIVFPVKYLKSCRVLCSVDFPFITLRHQQILICLHISLQILTDRRFTTCSLSLSLFIFTDFCAVTTHLWMHWLQFTVFKLLLFKTLMRTWSGRRHSVGFVPIVWLRDSKTSLLHRRLTCCCEKGMKIQNVSVFFFVSLSYKTSCCGRTSRKQNQREKGQFMSSQRTAAEVYVWGLLNIL